MNPILINPKIESDKSTGEQLQQMKSYLYQFKEQIELLLMNIDTDNVSAKFKEDITDFVGNKIMNGKEMSEIMQSAGMIKMSVQELNGAMATLSVSVSGISAEINNPDTGILVRLSATESGLSSKVSKNGVISSINQSPESITISANKLNLTGYITATDLSSTGTTVINGARIETGTLSVNAITRDGSGYIGLGNSNINELNVLGTLRFPNEDQSGISMLGATLAMGGGNITGAYNITATNKISAYQFEGRLRPGDLIDTTYVTVVDINGDQRQVLASSGVG